VRERGRLTPPAAPVTAATHARDPRSRLRQESRSGPLHVTAAALRRVGRNAPQGTCESATSEPLRPAARNRLAVIDRSDEGPSAGANSHRPARRASKQPVKGRLLEEPESTLSCPSRVTERIGGKREKAGVGRPGAYATADRSLDGAANVSRARVSDMRGSPTCPMYLYLTTTGRVTSQPPEIEIWFVEHGRHFTLLTSARAPTGAQYPVAAAGQGPGRRR
jgi:hypothetical protein